jgi:trimethylguanosine synthase
VIAIDIDAARISIAKHNAKIYGVEERIEFIVGDAVDILPHLKVDVIFLSPPWVHISPFLSTGRFIV